MSRLRFRNNWFKFKTSEKSPISLEEFREDTPIYQRKTERCQDAAGWIWKYYWISTGYCPQVMCRLHIHSKIPVVTGDWGAKVKELWNQP
jgi:hypothetical protein